MASQISTVELCWSFQFSRLWSFGGFLLLFSGVMAVSTRLTTSKTEQIGSAEIENVDPDDMPVVSVGRYTTPRVTDITPTWLDQPTLKDETIDRSMDAGQREKQHDTTGSDGNRHRAYSASTVSSRNTNRHRKPSYGQGLMTNRPNTDVTHTDGVRTISTVGGQPGLIAENTEGRGRPTHGKYITTESVTTADSVVKDLLDLSNKITSNDQDMTTGDNQPGMTKQVTKERENSQPFTSPPDAPNIKHTGSQQRPSSPMTTKDTSEPDLHILTSADHQPLTDDPDIPATGYWVSPGSAEVSTSPQASRKGTFEEVKRRRNRLEDDKTRGRGNRHGDRGNGRYGDGGDVTGFTKTRGDPVTSQPTGDVDTSPPGVTRQPSNDIPMEMVDFLHSLGKLNIGDDDVRGKDEDNYMNLQALVFNLQEQVNMSQTTQARTRSFLHRLEERQMAVENDLASLKNDLKEMRDVQKKDHIDLQTLHKTIGNSDWGIANVKSTQAQLGSDLHGLKEWLELHNDTLGEIGRESSSRELTQHSMLLRIRAQFNQMREAADEDRHLLHSLRDKVTGRGRHSQENNVYDNGVLPQRENSIDKGWSRESSEKIRKQSVMENQLQALEEVSNTVEHQIKQLSKNEVQMRQEVTGMSRKIGLYDSEISRMYTTLYNITLQVSGLENRMLADRQHHGDIELSQLQQNFLNFTQQLMHLQKWHLSSSQTLNSTTLDQLQLATQLAGIEGRLTAMENQQQEQERELQRGLSSQLQHVSAVNTTVMNLRLVSLSHHTEAARNQKEMQSSLSNMRAHLQQYGNRLLKIEVKVLNKSLNRCEKENTDMRQNNKLSEVSDKISRLDGQLVEHTRDISRMDRGIGQLYNELEDLGRSVSVSTDDIDSLLDITPQLEFMDQEVSNVILSLPRDCSEIAQRFYNPVERIYSIRPDRSPSSALTFCNFGEDYAWTVIQRRVDGKLSFDTGWEDYKAGFGSPSDEFWFGNDNLHYLSTQGDYMLHIDMWDLSDTYWYAEYDIFKVDEEGASYRLHIDGYHGNATDALRYSTFMPFSTPDLDNDLSSTHCAKFYTSGWWYKHCQYSNLNGRYTVGVVWFNGNLDQWMQLKKVEMKVRPVQDVPVVSNIIMTSTAP